MLQLRSPVYLGGFEPVYSKSVNINKTHVHVLAMIWVVCNPGQMFLILFLTLVVSIYHL